MVISTINGCFQIGTRPNSQKGRTGSSLIMHVTEGLTYCSDNDGAVANYMNILLGLSTGEVFLKEHNFVI